MTRAKATTLESAPWYDPPPDAFAPASRGRARRKRPKAKPPATRRARAKADEPTDTELREAAARLAARDDAESIEALAIIGAEVEQRRQAREQQRFDRNFPLPVAPSAASLDEQVDSLKADLAAVTSPEARVAIVAKLGPLEDMILRRDQMAQTTAAMASSTVDEVDRETRIREAWEKLDPVAQLRVKVDSAANDAMNLSRRADALPLDGAAIFREVARLFRRVASAGPPAGFQG